MERIVSRVDEMVDEGIEDPQEHLSLGQEMREADGKWRGSLLRMRHSDDFQTAELYQFWEAHLRRNGVSLAEVEALAVWQADVLEAFGSRRPMPPAPVDPTSEKALELRSVLDSVRLGGSHVLSLDADPASRTTSSSVAEEELRALKKDHLALLQMGQCYGSFDQAGKKIFLDQMEGIAGRWEVHLTRLQLMGELPPEFTGAGDATGLLERLRLSPASARELVSEAHKIMRDEVEG